MSSYLVLHHSCTHCWSLGSQTTSFVLLLPKRHLFVNEAPYLVLWPLVVEVRCTRQSPLMRGKSCGPCVVKVRYMRQSPPTRGRFLRPFMVEVCCTWQCPPTRGRSLNVIKVRCMRQSPPTRGRSLSPFVVEVHCTWQSPLTRGRIFEVITPNDEWYVWIDAVICAHHQPYWRVTIFIISFFIGLSACLRPHLISCSPSPRGRISQDPLPKPTTWQTKSTSSTF